MLARQWSAHTGLVRLVRRLQSTGKASPSVIPPVLLARARAQAEEHAKLAQQLHGGYNNTAAKKVGALSHVAASLAKWDAANKNLLELQSLISDRTTERELRDLASEELVATNTELQGLTSKLENALVPAHPFASLPCLIELRPGAGGDEASLFAGDLLRMYTAYCKAQNLPLNVVNLETEPGPSDLRVQQAILEVNKEGAYDFFRCEAGVHRVQRVPATESKGRTHTSAVSVIVLPNFPDRENGAVEEGAEFDLEDPNSDYYVNTADVRVETMRSRGAGGQHVNMTDSAVRLTHIPTNTVVAMQNQRSQLKNREKAWQILRARLAQSRREAREDEMAQLRRGVVGVARMGRGDKIRTYNWGQQRVTDHRCGFSVFDLDGFMAGQEGLTVMMDEVRAWLRARDLEALIAGEEASAMENAKGAN